MRYEFGSKEKLLAFGRYPEISLAEARDRRHAIKQVLRQGRDPALERQRQRLEYAECTAISFETLARDWHTRQTPTWTERHAADVLTSLERDVFPVIGKQSVTEITAPMVLNLLRAIEARPAIETARRVRQRMSAVFVYAHRQRLGRHGSGGYRTRCHGAAHQGRQPAVVEIDEARTVLSQAEAIPAYPVTKLALRLLALSAVRPARLGAWLGGSSNSSTQTNQYGGYQLNA